MTPYDADANSRKDRLIIKALPYVVIISAVSGITLMLIMGRQDIGRTLLELFSPFVIGFAGLGVFSFYHRGRGLLDWRITVMILLATPFLISVILVFFTSYVMPEVLEFLEKLTLTTTNKIITVFGFVYALMFLMVLTSHGVISTVVAYFRRYTTMIYLSIEKIKNDATDSARGKFSRWIYEIPDVIDIRSVELEPAHDNDTFPVKMFFSMAFSIFALGLSISSYIFLNPIFQSTFTLGETVAITVILSFFVPVLVIPWFITKSTGAKIKSQARDYYLWKGMKRRLYQGFFAVMFLLSMFAISVYLGYDIWRTSMTYAGYVAITAFLSLLYSFVYINFYYSGFKKAIIDDFNEAKK